MADRNPNTRPAFPAIDYDRMLADLAGAVLQLNNTLQKYHLSPAASIELASHDDALALKALPHQVAFRYDSGLEPNLDPQVAATICGLDFRHPSQTTLERARRSAGGSY